MQDEPYDDHEREEDIERNGNRVEWNAGACSEGVLDAAQLGGLIKEYHAHTCVNWINRESLSVREALERVPQVVMYIRHGKATTQ